LAARKAVHDSLRRLRRDLRNAVDPRVWVKRHPWLAVTTAAAAGFVLADNLRPAAPPPYPVQPPNPPTSPPPSVSTPDTHQPPPPHSWRSTISREILAVMRPVLIAAITQHLKSTLFTDDPATSTEPPTHNPPAA
jgi:hypothetical protein